MILKASPLVINIVLDFSLSNVSILLYMHLPGLAVSISKADGFFSLMESTESKNLI